MSSNKYEGNLRNTPIRRNRPNIPKDAAILINADNVCLLICITSVFRLLSLHYEIKKVSNSLRIWRNLRDGQNRECRERDGEGWIVQLRRDAKVKQPLQAFSMKNLRFASCSAGLRAATTSILHAATSHTISFTLGFIKMLLQTFRKIDATGK